MPHARSLVALLLLLSLPLAAAAQQARSRAQAETFPPLLIDGAAAYFSGEYQRALDLLRAESFPDPKAETQRRLFVAAAAWSLLQLGGETDASLRAIALDNVRACRALAPRLVPDAKAFSPRFVAWFRTSG